MSKYLVAVFLLVIGVAFLFGNGVLAQSTATTKLTMNDQGYYIFNDTTDLKPIFTRMINNVVASGAVMVKYTGSNPKFTSFIGNEFAVILYSSNSGPTGQVVLYQRSGSGPSSFFTPLDCFSGAAQGYSIPVDVSKGTPITFLGLIDQCEADGPQDLEASDGKNNAEMASFLNVGQTLVNETITLGSYSLDSGVAPTVKTPNTVTTTSTLQQGDYTTCVPSIDSQKIDLDSTTNSYGIATNGIPLPNGSIGASVGPNSNFPVSFIIYTGNVQRYLLQVWDYHVNGDKVTIRANLCFNENGTFKNYWTNVNYITYSDETLTKKDNTTVKNTSAASVTINEKLNHPELSARFLHDYRSDVQVYFYLVEHNKIVTIDGVAVDGRKDIDNSILRAKLTAGSIKILREKVKEFANLPPNQIEEDVNITLEGKQSTAGKNVKMDVVSGGTLQTAAHYDDEYYKSAPKVLIPGPYTLKLTILPTGSPATSSYEIISRDIVLVPANFSTDVGWLVGPSDLFPIEIEDKDVLKDICSPCNDLSSCLACFDSKLVVSYQK